MVRDYQPSDLERILKIWLQSNLQAHDFIDRSYWEKNYDFVRCLLPQSQVLVWEQDGEVPGFAGSEGRNIEGIFVSTQFRSKGIGTAILQEAKRRFPSLTLQVYCKNRRAFLFYQREGFSIIKEEMDPDTGEAEYQMVWKKADGKED